MLIHKILLALVFPLDLIWRHQMGERFCSWGKLIGITFGMRYAIAYISIFTGDLGAQSTLHPGALLILDLTVLGLTPLIWILFLLNRLEIRRRKKSGIELHTYFMGLPRFLPNNKFVREWFIPFGSLMLGVGFYQLFRPVGIFVCVMALFQWCVYCGMDRQERIRKMDQMDRVLMQQYKSGEHENPIPGVVQVSRVSNLQTGTTDETIFNERWKGVLKPRGN